MLNITHYQRNANQNHNEVPSHTGQNAIKKSTNNKCWRGCGMQTNVERVLVGMQTNTATMENSVEIPHKTGNRTAIQPIKPTAGHTH